VIGYFFIWKSLKTRFGGFLRLNKVFDGELENVLVRINEELWRDVG
jgi:type I restriction enzyme, R subunit